MRYTVSFFKEKQKFSAAHFTLFANGEVERLHGHNYTVAVHISGDKLDAGLLFPFHQIKPRLQQLCDALDEYVLIPASSSQLQIEKHDGNVQIRLKTRRVDKFYSFPDEDVILLEMDNISCENLARHFLEGMEEVLREEELKATALEVTLGESSGQTVTVSREDVHESN